MSELKHYSEGVAFDGAAILCDGHPITISEILALLNQHEQLKFELIAQEPIGFIHPTIANLLLDKRFASAEILLKTNKTRGHVLPVFIQPQLTTKMEVANTQIEYLIARIAEADASNVHSVVRQWLTEVVQ